MKTIIYHILLWLFAAIACILIGSCGKDHIATLIPNASLMQPKQPSKGEYDIHPIPWKIVGVYDSREDFYMYNLTDFRGDTIRVIDYDLERWLKK